MRITINLATRPFADLEPTIKRLRIAMAVLAAVAIGLGFGLRSMHHKAEEARARDHSLDGAIARVLHEQQGYQDMMRQPTNAAILTQSVDLNKLFDEKAFSWTLAMEDLETVLPGGVQVTTLEPTRAKDGHITLRLRVAGPRDRDVELVKNLEHSRRFVLPRIVGESSEANGTTAERLEPVSDSNHVSFELLADYNPASPGERKHSGKAVDEKAGTGGSPSHRPNATGPGMRRPPYTGTPHARPLIPKPQAGGPQ
jgi:type IV pilus assembly protein PilN